MTRKGIRRVREDMYPVDWGNVEVEKELAVTPKVEVDRIRELFCNAQRRGEKWT